MFVADIETVLMRLPVQSSGLTCGVPSPRFVAKKMFAGWPRQMLQMAVGAEYSCI